MAGQDGPTIDEAVLDGVLDSVGGDSAFVADLVDTYLSDAPAHLDAIDTAVGAGDSAALVRPAHTLKTGSLTIGAIRLGEMSRGLEMQGRAEQLDGAADAARALRAEFQNVQTQLRSWIAARKGS
jgi:HPt (histidine-containing phosphotransfer) domain-containing protein